MINPISLTGFGRSLVETSDTLSIARWQLKQTFESMCACKVMGLGRRSKPRDRHVLQTGIHFIFRQILSGPGERGTPHR